MNKLDDVNNMDRANRLIAPIIFAVFAALAIFFFVKELSQLNLLRSGFAYLSVLLVACWWAFALGIVFLILKFIHRRVVSILALVLFGTLVFPVGIEGMISIGGSRGYTMFLSLLIYFLPPFLFSFVALLIQAIKARDE